MDQALATTAPLWPAIDLTYGWIHRAAHVLANHDAHDGATVRTTYEALLTAMAARRAEAGVLAPAVDHFLKVTRRDGAGLFHGYDVDGLPRTNNDLEHTFGTARLHERRATGRKTASATLVVRGAVRVVASVATQHRARPFGEADLRLRCPADLARWRQARQQLTYRHEARRAQRRFRRQPDAYLTALEDRLLQSGLPT